MTDTYNYDAFGANTEHQGASNNKYQYAGEQKDSTSNYYLRARYYNPNIGCFTQMDSYMGQSNNPITLHKYLYANANPVMYTDPSAGMSGMATLSTMSTGVRIGMTGQVLIRPLIATLSAGQTTAQASISVIGLVVAAKKYCETNDSCKPKFPILIYGLNHGELTTHVHDAITEGGSTGIPLPNVLTYIKPKNSRSWLNRTSICNQNARSLHGKKADCDEYPFASSRQGGKMNSVSLRLIDPDDNQDGGRLLGGMLRADKTVANQDSYIVLAHSMVPLSFYWTRKGKVGMSKGIDPDGE